MSRYKIGDEVLIKGAILCDVDEDGDYRIKVTVGEEDYENLYVHKTKVIGKVTDYERKEKYMIGDVLRYLSEVCVISGIDYKERRVMVTFSDGSGGWREISSLDEYSKHTGENIAVELDAVLSHLKEHKHD